MNLELVQHEVRQHHRHRKYEPAIKHFTDSNTEEWKCVLRADLLLSSFTPHSKLRPVGFGGAILVKYLFTDPGRAVL